MDNDKPKVLVYLSATVTSCITLVAILKKYNMKKVVFLFLIIFTFSLINCSSSHSNKSNISLGLTGKLDDQTYQNLLNLLEQFDGNKPKDTIIIKYDYENRSCWSALDMQNQDYILKIVKNSQARIKKQVDKRPNISVYRFAELGNRFNNIILLDKTILKDSNNSILNLIFTDESSCGNSIIIIPGQKYIYKKTDPHFELLEISKKRIIDILEK